MDFLGLLADAAQEQGNHDENLVGNVNAEVDELVANIFSQEQDTKPVVVKLESSDDLVSSLSEENQIVFTLILRDFQSQKISMQEFVERSKGFFSPEQLKVFTNEPISNKRQLEQPVAREAKKPKVSEQISSGFPSPLLGTLQPEQESADQVDVTKLDVDSMMDVTSYGGVNLTDEQEEILGDLSKLGPVGDADYSELVDRIKVQNLFHNDALAQIISQIATKNGLESIDEDFMAFVGLACQERLVRLMERMIIIAKHRSLLLHEHYLEKDRISGDHVINLQVQVTQDIKATLSQLEQLERDEEAELRKNRAIDMGESVEDSEWFNAALQKKTKSALSDAKKAMKAAKKNMQMPESVKSKLSNATALKAAGGALKSWMLPEGAQHKVVSRPSKTKFREPPTGTLRGQSVDLCRKMTAKEARRVILKDALQCLENDSDLKKSDLLYKWGIFIK